MNFKEAQVFVVALMISLLFFSCQKDDVIVQSLYDLSGAPLKYDDSKATRFLNVASVSIEPTKNKQENLFNIKQKSIQITEEYPEVELILFGETILGWYCDEENPESYQRSIAEVIPGNATQFIGNLSDSLKVYIAFGMTEKRDGELYNSQVLVNPMGEIEALHRKITLTPEDKKSGFTASSKTPENVTIVNINNIKVGMMVCADMGSYWLTEQLTGQKVELILHSMASAVPEFGIDAVSRQLNAWEVFANRYGKEGKYSYSGTTFIADPSGTIRISGSGREMIKTYKIGVR
ncbi:MAG: carbon-nitrogen hydrolase family protein [Prolixibacteraceae bacterium]|nr:carbon-nitrogen hydrolase family protein [Prolixibacteraceae bacterium]